MSEEFLKKQDSLRAKFKAAASLVDDFNKAIKMAPQDKVNFELDAPATVVFATYGTQEKFVDLLHSSKGAYCREFMRLAEEGELSSDNVAYRRRSLIGGERFVPFNAYIGATGRPIVRLVEMPDVGDMRTLDPNQFIELEYNEAKGHFDGFGSLITKYSDVSDDKYGEDAIAAILEQQKFAANNKYGSW